MSRHGKEQESDDIIQQDTDSSPQSLGHVLGPSGHMPEMQHSIDRIIEPHNPYQSGDGDYSDHQALTEGSPVFTFHSLDHLPSFDFHDDMVLLEADDDDHPDSICSQYDVAIDNNKMIASPIKPLHQTPYLSECGVAVDHTETKDSASPSRESHPHSLNGRSPGPPSPSPVHLTTKPFQRSNQQSASPPLSGSPHSIRPPPRRRGGLSRKFKAIIESESPSHSVMEISTSCSSPELGSRKTHHGNDSSGNGDDNDDGNNSIQHCAILDPNTPCSRGNDTISSFDIHGGGHGAADPSMLLNTSADSKRPPTVTPFSSFRIPKRSSQPAYAPRPRRERAIPTHHDSANSNRNIMPTVIGSGGSGDIDNKYNSDEEEDTKPSRVDSIAHGDKDSHDGADDDDIVVVTSISATTAAKPHSLVLNKPDAVQPSNTPLLDQLRLRKNQRKRNRGEVLPHAISSGSEEGAAVQLSSSKPAITVDISRAKPFQKLFKRQKPNTASSHTHPTHQNTHTTASSLDPIPIDDNNDSDIVVDPAGSPSADPTNATCIKHDTDLSLHPPNQPSPCNTRPLPANSPMASSLDNVQNVHIPSMKTTGRSDSQMRFILKHDNAPHGSDSDGTSEDPIDIAAPPSQHLPNILNLLGKRRRPRVKFGVHSDHPRDTTSTLPTASPPNTSESRADDSVKVTVDVDGVGSRRVTTSAHHTHTQSLSNANVDPPGKHDTTTHQHAPQPAWVYFPNIPLEDAKAYVQRDYALFKHLLNTVYFPFMKSYNELSTVLSQRYPVITQPAPLHGIPPTQGVYGLGSLDYQHRDKDPSSNGPSTTSISSPSQPSSSSAKATTSPAVDSIPSQRSPHPTITVDMTWYQHQQLRLFYLHHTQIAHIIAMHCPSPGDKTNTSSDKTNTSSDKTDMFHRIRLLNPFIHSLLSIPPIKASSGHQSHWSLFYNPSHRFIANDLFSKPIDAISDPSDRANLVRYILAYRFFGPQYLFSMTQPLPHHHHHHHHHHHQQQQQQQQQDSLPGIETLTIPHTTKTPNIANTQHTHALGTVLSQSTALPIIPSEHRPHLSMVHDSPDSPLFTMQSPSDAHTSTHPHPCTQDFIITPLSMSTLTLATAIGPSSSTQGKLSLAHSSGPRSQYGPQASQTPPEPPYPLTIASYWCKAAPILPPALQIKYQSPLHLEQHPRRFRHVDLDAPQHSAFPSQLLIVSSLAASPDAVTVHNTLHHYYREFRQYQVYMKDNQRLFDPTPSTNPPSSSNDTRLCLPPSLSDEWIHHAHLHHPHHSFSSVTPSHHSEQQQPPTPLLQPPFNEPPLARVYWGDITSSTSAITHTYQFLHRQKPSTQFVSMNMAEPSIVVHPVPSLPSPNKATPSAPSLSLPRPPSLDSTAAAEHCAESPSTPSGCPLVQSLHAICQTMQPTSSPSLSSTVNPSTHGHDAHHQHQQPQQPTSVDHILDAKRVAVDRAILHHGSREDRIRTSTLSGYSSINYNDIILPVVPPFASSPNAPHTASEPLSSHMCRQIWFDENIKNLFLHQPFTVINNPQRLPVSLANLACQNPRSDCGSDNHGDHINGKIIPNNNDDSHDRHDDHRTNNNNPLESLPLHPTCPTRLPSDTLNPTYLGGIGASMTLYPPTIIDASFRTLLRAYLFEQPWSKMRFYMMDVIYSSSYSLSEVNTVVAFYNRLPPYLRPPLPSHLPSAQSAPLSVDFPPLSAHDMGSSHARLVIRHILLSNLINSPFIMNPSTTDSGDPCTPHGLAPEHPLPSPLSRQAPTPNILIHLVPTKMLTCSFMFPPAMWKSILQKSIRYMQHTKFQQHIHAEISAKQPSSPASSSSSSPSSSSSSSLSSPTNSHPYPRAKQHIPSLYADAIAAKSVSSYDGLTTVRLALQLALQHGIVELARRVIILCIEETIIHPGLPYIIHIVILASKGAITPSGPNGQSQPQPSTRGSKPSSSASHQGQSRRKPKGASGSTHIASSYTKGGVEHPLPLLANEMGATNAESGNSTQAPQQPQPSSSQRYAGLDSYSCLKMHHVNALLTFVYQITHCAIRDDIPSPKQLEIEQPGNPRVTKEVPPAFAPPSGMDNKDPQDTAHTPHPEGFVYISPFDNDGFVSEMVDSLHRHIHQRQHQHQHHRPPSSSSASIVSPQLVSIIETLSAVLPQPLRFLHSSNTSTRMEDGTTTTLLPHDMIPLHSDTQIEVYSSQGQSILLLLRDMSIAYQFVHQCLVAITRSIHHSQCEGGAVEDIPPIRFTSSSDNDDNAHTIIPLIHLTLRSDLPLQLGLTLHQTHIIQSLLLRCSLGGMHGDIGLCRNAALVWCLRFAYEQMDGLRNEVHSMRCLLSSHCQDQPALHQPHTSILPTLLSYLELLTLPNSPMMTMLNLVEAFETSSSFPFALRPPCIYIPSHSGDPAPISSSQTLPQTGSSPMNAPPHHPSQHAPPTHKSWLSFLSYIYSGMDYGFDLVYGGDRVNLHYKVPSVLQPHFKQVKSHDAPLHMFSTQSHQFALDKLPCGGSNTAKTTIPPQKTFTMMSSNTTFSVILSPRLIDALQLNRITPTDIVASGIDSHCSEVLIHTLSFHVVPDLEDHHYFACVFDEDHDAGDDDRSSHPQPLPSCSLEAPRRVLFPPTPLTIHDITTTSAFLRIHAQNHELAESLLVTHHHRSKHSDRAFHHAEVLQKLHLPSLSGLEPPVTGADEQATLEEHITRRIHHKYNIILTSEELHATLSSLMWTCRSSINHRIPLKPLQSALLSYPPLRNNDYSFPQSITDHPHIQSYRKPVMLTPLERDLFNFFLPYWDYYSVMLVYYNSATYSLPSV